MRSVYLAGLVLALFSSCKRTEAPKVEERLRLQRGELLAAYDGPVTAAARGKGKLFAVGTSGGSVIVDEGARRVRMLRATEKDWFFLIKASGIS